MPALQNKINLAKAVIANPQILKLHPSLNLFLLRYMMQFPTVKAGKHTILHSHLPPLNSRAYNRFVREQLLSKNAGPSHAQIGVTNACPQNCEYCYNKNRTGRVMDSDTIKKVIRELKETGLVWLGLTGGEPLLNRDLPEIVSSAAADCAVKLFTTGCTLTKDMAADLKSAGLFSVCISLDHWLEDEHDRARRYPGAYKAALKAIEVFRNTGIHVSISAVLSRDMIRNNQTEEFLAFVMGLGADEAWLSEVKPSVEAFWDDSVIITEDERLMLSSLQDRYNKTGKFTVNYLGHFEGKEHFGCNAGCKMVYVDAFGEVSPCVFTPMTFGNVHENSIKNIVSEMRALFRPSQDGCFINKNYKLLQKYSNGQAMLDKDSSRKMMDEVSFGQPSSFGRLYYR